MIFFNRKKQNHSALRETEAQPSGLRAVLFDLDGVLLDSAPDIAVAVNYALKYYGYNPIPQEVLITFVGDGSRKLIARAVECSSSVTITDVPIERLEKVLERFLEYYENHFADGSTLYDGVAETLETFYVLGIHMGIVSNKPGRIMESILDHFCITDYFDVSVGPEQVKRMKPDPEPLAFAAREISANLSNILRPEEVIMVGDSASDIEAGRAFGAKTCAVVDGYGNREKLLAARPDFSIEYLPKLVPLVVK